MAPRAHPLDPTAQTYVIVGAGLAGASTAYHLRRAGVHDVVVVERERTPGAHSSGRNAAIVRGDAEAPELAELTRASADVLRRGELAPFKVCGGFQIGRGTDDASAHMSLARGRGRWQPGDGVVDVAALLATYLRGIEVRTETAVESFERTGGRWRIETSRGPIVADVLVNAAGAWAGELGDLPLVPTNRHLHVTTPMAGVDPDAPYVWDFAADYYFRPESGGLLLCACEEVPSVPGEPDVDPDALERLAAKLRVHQPALADVEILRSWVGQRTFAPDRLPVIGFDPRRPGFFHMGGFGGYGVTVSYAAGSLAADLMLRRTLGATPFDVQRVLRAAEGAGAG